MSQAPATVGFLSAVPQFTVSDVVRTAEYYRFQVAGYWDGEHVTPRRASASSISRGGVRALAFRARLLAIAGVLVSGVLVSADKLKGRVIWPGYILELPANYCVNSRNGPDFHVLYLRDRQSAQRTILVGIYTGHAPNFHPDCVKPVTRTWSAQGLSFRSVRGADGCAVIGYFYFPIRHRFQ